jgi:hypothetical protein
MTGVGQQDNILPSVVENHKHIHFLYRTTPDPNKIARKTAK